jgi:putative phosphoribosyl transferase
MQATPFADRREAGRRLAEALGEHAGKPGLLVLALPRGGVPVAYEVAEALGAPLDIFLVRKLGVPGHEELAMGAIASGGVRVMNDDVMRMVRVSEQAVDEVAAREERELERREAAYRDGRPAPDVRALRKEGVGELVVAVPVAAPETCASLRDEVDDIVCLLTPERFLAVGLWYRDFGQTTDREVRELLSRARSNDEPSVRERP